MRKVVASISGGLDSAVMLANILDVNPEVQVLAVSFLYGSSHNTWELSAKTALISNYNQTRREKQLPPIVGETFDLRNVFGKFSSGLLTGDIPSGHYEEESMRQTVVPGRNAIFLAVLAGLAQSIGAERVYIGVHAGDHFIYPDCRPDFIRQMNHAVQAASEGQVSISAPLLDCNKRDIVRLGIKRGVPFNLTRTCYSRHQIACGKCGSCQERLEAFKLNDRDDPLTYASRDLIPKTHQAV